MLEAKEPLDQAAVPTGEHGDGVKNIMERISKKILFQCADGPADQDCRQGCSEGTQQ